MTRKYMHSTRNCVKPVCTGIRFIICVCLWTFLITAIKDTVKDTGAKAQDGSDPAWDIPADTAIWRAVEQENLLYMTTDLGTAIIELTPHIAPQAVAQVKSLARNGFYDGLDFYRVIENFVAQGGQGGQAEPINNSVAQVQAELDAAIELFEDFWVAQNPGLIGPHEGFSQGFAVVADHDRQTGWFAHCTGIMALARGNDIHSATSEFYFPIGQSPRHLDHNLTVIGRVVFGFAAIQGVRRAAPDSSSGLIEDAEKRTKIKSVRVGADLAKNAQTRLLVMRTDTESFRQRVNARKNRQGAFWHHKPTEKFDICTLPVPVRVVQ